MLNAKYFLFSLILTTVVSGLSFSQINTPPIARVPFGSNLNYSGNIMVPGNLPTNGNFGHAQDAADAYNQWKIDYIEACGNGQYRVRWDEPDKTVSEGIAYGMLLAAYAADFDLFDGLWSYYKERRNDNGLMDFKIKGCTLDILGSGSASDGDIDAAMALMVASYQWPSLYENEAKDLIRDIKKFEIDTVQIDGLDILQLNNGDSWSSSENCRNPSYQGPAYFRKFGAFTNDRLFWSRCAQGSYQLLNNNIDDNTGLVSNWSDIYGNPNNCNGANEYGFDASRNPWRMATDVAWFNDSNAKNICNKIAGYVQVVGSDIVGGPVAQSGGIGAYHNATFISTFALAVMAADTIYQGLLDEMYLETINSQDSLPFYFGNTLRCISLFMMTGNFWNPANSTTTPIKPGYITETKVMDRIGPELLFLSELGSNDTSMLSKSLLQLNDENKVLIEILALDGQYENIVSYLNSIGVSANDFVQDQVPGLTDSLLITAFLPVELLSVLNQQNSLINFVRPVNVGLTNSGLIDSQGDVAQGSFNARSGWNLDGEGIKVGVISNSYATDESSRVNDINNGDLPSDDNPVQVIEEYPYGIASDEGRAMLQIIHDVAPASELFFHTGFVSEANFAYGVRQLREEGCDIIVDDVQYTTEPFFRDGLIAQAVDEVTAAGAYYFSAAGNFGSRSFSETFTPAPSPNEDKHDFGDGDYLQSVELGTGDYIIVLQWDDEFYSLGNLNGASVDLDIYLVEDDGTILYGFNRDNNGDDASGIPGGDPIEILPFSVESETTSNIMIQMDGSGTMPAFKYIVFQAGDEGIFEAEPPLSDDTGGATIVGHANSEGSITIGATRYSDTPKYGNELSLESFSSIGGTPVNGVIW